MSAPRSNHFGVSWAETPITISRAGLAHRITCVFLRAPRQTAKGAFNGAVFVAAVCQNDQPCGWR